jgi:integrase
MERHLFPTLGNRLIKDIHSADVLTVLRGIEAKGHNELAKNLRQYCEAVYRWAVFSNLAERNIGLELRGSLSSVKVQHRPAIIDPQGVGQLLRAIDGYEGTPITLAALRLLPYVFTRPGELRHMEWGELKLDVEEPVWIIPAEKMKMREAHIVPLSRQVIAILKNIYIYTGEGQYVFPSERTLSRPMSNNTINAALRRLGYSTDDHCGHGFRAMASTLLNELQFPRDVIERQLAHCERNSVRSAYNRAQYLTERRIMMQKWANYLDELKGKTRAIQ